MEINREKKGMRCITFNVNGIRTLFQHYPFSRMNPSVKDVMEYFNADILTLQELKIDSKGVSKWGKADGYQSYISLPRKKKGYSGVGCWIRIPPEDDPLRDYLRVLKAEEGITGLLKVHSTTFAYRDSPEGIGGYDGLDFVDDKTLLEIDSEGRCVAIELACNIVVICTYCPANSMQTEEGEEYRLTFLKVLFKRIRNIYAMGKEVILMGDINVCRDLIDQAAGLDEYGILMSDNKTGSEIELKFKEQCMQFIMEPSRKGRRLLNTMLCDSIVPTYAEHAILVDSTRKIQGRDRLKMYTVWNTLLNTRPVNYGSRIDYIFVTKGLQQFITHSNIYPEVMGSDHCPVLTDITVEELTVNKASSNRPKFEATSRYSLNQGNIMDMFRKTQQKQLNAPSSHANKVVKQAFKTTSKPRTNQLPTTTVSKREYPSANLSSSPEKRTHLQAFRDILGVPPECLHGEPAVLRTSKTEKNFGKKFWVCGRSKGDRSDPEASCDFFQWK